MSPFPQFHSSRQQRGYILIYVAGILLFLSATVMGMAVALRLDTQVLLRQKENLQAEYRLEAGIQYALAQLGRTAAVEGAAGIDQRTKAGMGLWRPNGSKYLAEIGGASVQFVLEDAGGPVDLNTLSEGEWRTYFAVLGIGTVEEISLWSRRLVEARQIAAQLNGSNGFHSIDDVLALESIPAIVRYGRQPGGSVAAVDQAGGQGFASNSTAAVAPVTSAGPDGKTGAADNAPASIPGLRELFSVGTSMRQVEVNRGPIQLIAVLTQASIDNLIKFEEARAKKPLTVDEATKMLGGSSASVLYVGKSPLLRLRLETDAGAGRLGMSVLLKQDGSSYKTLEKRLVTVNPANSLLNYLPPLRDPNDPLNSGSAPATQGSGTSATSTAQGAAAATAGVNPGNSVNSSTR
jgi:hypothetical protein